MRFLLMVNSSLSVSSLVVEAAVAVEEVVGESPPEMDEKWIKKIELILRVYSIPLESNSSYYRCQRFDMQTRTWLAGPDRIKFLLFQRNETLYKLKAETSLG